MQPPYSVCQVIRVSQLLVTFVGGVAQTPAFVEGDVVRIPLIAFVYEITGSPSASVLRAADDATGAVARGIVYSVMRTLLGGMGDVCGVQQRQ